MSSIHQLPADERPREKLARCGAAALSDSELLAILLRTGVEGANAIEVGRQLLTRYGSLGGIARCSVPELARMRGIGPAKAVQLAAAFGLAARLARETYGRIPLERPAQVYELLAPQMQWLEKESLRVVLLDRRLRLMRVEEISLGSAEEGTAHPREILRPVILYGASAFALAHNHPSGDASPSQADRGVTRRVQEAARMLLVDLMDHLIIGQPGVGAFPKGYFSFRESGLL